MVSLGNSNEDNGISYSTCIPTSRVSSTVAPHIPINVLRDARRPTPNLPVPSLTPGHPATISPLYAAWVPDLNILSSTRQSHSSPQALPCTRSPSWLRRLRLTERHLSTTCPTSMRHGRLTNDRAIHSLVVPIQSSFLWARPTRMRAPSRRIMRCTYVEYQPLPIFVAVTSAFGSLFTN